MKHTRFEYIGPNGREITLYGEFEQSVQDDGQTLKVFGSEAVAGWRPIETAPKDGTEVLGRHHKFGKRIRLMWYFRASSMTQMWRDENGNEFKPDAWMPLPTAPGVEQ